LGIKYIGFITTPAAIFMLAGIEKEGNAKNNENNSFAKVFLFLHHLLDL
jgi:hypothetical protein